MNEKCLIEKTKRSRVKGSGPSRAKLKIFHKLGTVSTDTIDELTFILDKNKNNDIGGDNYAISANCNYEEVFNVGLTYRQILLQENPNEDKSTIDEYLYTKWNEQYKLDSTKTDLYKIFNNIYRLRLSEMHSNHEMNWHIDADTSVICRAQICLNENDSVYEAKDKNNHYKLTMKPGEVWFINTGWQHRVVNGNSLRRVAVFGFHFDNLYNNSQLFL